MESLRILGILLYKSWLVRKRHWITSLIVEILLPIGIILCPWLVLGGATTPPKLVPEAHFEMKSFEELISKTPYHKILYAPNTTFTYTMTTLLKECLRNDSVEEIRAFHNEAELLEYHRINGSYSSSWAIIFDDLSDYNNKHLHYKFRHNSWIKTDLYSHYYENGYLTRLYIEDMPFVQTQICLHKSFIRTTLDDHSIPEVSIQQIPFPAHLTSDENAIYYSWAYIMFYAVAFMFPLIVETARATDEKFVGMNVLMSMNGISNTMNLLSWIISGFVIVTVFCAIPNLLVLTSASGRSLPYVNYGNSLILFFTLAFYTAHILTFGVHLSAYFSKALLVTFVIMILSVMPILLMMFAIKDDDLYLVPYLGIILPNFLLYQALQEFRFYEATGEGVRWGNLFKTADSTEGMSGGVGLIILLFILGTIFHFSLAIYVYTIKPGKYGVGKHPLFFLMFKNKNKINGRVENISYDHMKGTSFEPIPPGVHTPGIQIRNLTKAYNINVFSKEKVHALRGVSVDFYKGQITSLLGHNGAGKTTMMSILTGMISPSDGLVLINSKNLKDNASEIMNDMGLCTQEDMYFSSLTVSEQLLFFSMVKRKGKSNSEIRRNVNNLLEKLKLFDKRNSLPRTLSGGQKRRLCLGMALVGDSSTLILDEPTSGLDPESRRVIWNILLKMRGEKTILISTHDMEEADVLGDRIAIMHTGQLRSYGTSLFLKKMIGQNSVEVTLSIEPYSDTERIRRELHQEGFIMSRKTNKMVVSIPNSIDLPDTLDNLEEKKKILGVSGFSVSLISLEQVFLKTTYEHDESTKSHHAVTNYDENKLTGFALCAQRIKALLSKKLTYALKDYSILMIELFTVLIALLLIAVILEGIAALTSNDPDEVIHMDLDKYDNPEVFYNSPNKSLGDQYKNVAKNLGGKVIEITDTSLENGLIRHGKEDTRHYEKYTIAAAEFKEITNNTVLNAFYSERATFSLPISINLISNTIVKNLNINYSISFSMQKFPNTYFFNNVFFTYLSSIATAIVFAFFFYYTIAMFVIQPLRESTTGIKQLQKMTGLSVFTYWGTMFLFDMMIYMILIVVTVGGFACIDYSFDLQLYGSRELWIMILLLFLFAINTLPLLYIFSFVKMKTSTVVRLLTYIPVGIVIFDLVMLFAAFAFRDKDGVQKLRSVQKALFHLLPYESFLHTQMTFQMVAQINAKCKTLPNDYYDSQCTSWNNDPCCQMGCYNGTCEEYKNFFDYTEESISSKESLTYLYIMPIVYFIILALLETQLIQKIKAKFTHDFLEESNSDEQVRREKAMICRKIKEFEMGSDCTNDDYAINGQGEHYSGTLNNQVFMVYELQKSYKHFRAVTDVSFSVNRQECFGLLGVNGAGKSTTFRMMTGEELPDHGTMYLGDKNFENNEKYFLSQMGYCPQHDAILKCLNSYDHLRLFARLRGIPENHIENEVVAWIERLNLSACALQPSGTYSGGNKRRLNIAIALIGNPNLVLMDEPTTGVDPGARRSLWNVIKDCQMAGQAVVLTSHSMEECEALCNRLAIMVDGKLVCIGASEELKQRFGAGYDIQIKMDLEKAKTQLDSIKNDVPRMLNCVLTDENLGNLMYHVAPAGTTWRKMYDVMNGIKNKYDCIDEFLVLSSSLEQLFLLFARTANANTRVS